jgi:hypothetical protein
LPTDFDSGFFYESASTFKKIFLRHPTASVATTTGAFKHDPHRQGRLEQKSCNAMVVDNHHAYYHRRKLKPFPVMVKFNHYFVKICNIFGAELFMVAKASSRCGARTS